jgi:hypothetical protein
MNILIFYSFFVLCFLSIFILCLYSLWNSLSLSNSSYNVAFSFSYVVNLFFRLLTSIFKFPIFRFTIAMVWNNLVVLSTYITSATTSSTDLGVLVFVVGFLNPFLENPNSYTIWFLGPNSNGCPYVHCGLLASTCSSSDLNIVKGGYVFIISFCRPFCVYCCCCYYCCKFCGLSLLSI